MNDIILNQIRQEVIRCGSVRRVVLFGSRARNDFNEKSDYDIAVLGADDSDRNRIIDFAENLPTLYKIDIIFVTDKLKKTALYQNIKKDGIVIMDKFLNKLENYKKAVIRLEEVIGKYKELNIDELQDAAIQRFEFTTELAWKTTREYLLSESFTDINSPKSVMRTAFENGLVTNEQGWITILNDRNITSHIYDEDEASDVYERIASQHIILFKELLNILKEKSSE